MIKTTERLRREKLRREKLRQERLRQERLRRARAARTVMRPRLRLRPRPLIPPNGGKIKRRPFYKKWWFWGAIAAGVAVVVGASLGATLGRKTETVLPSGSLGVLDKRF